ncbi:restriction endonuclease subunit S [Enterococcus faecalis]|uniref:restriction endonuclease subunit S n=1 Tax=Enterococcus faecalis TaxID=1351 RepID=UPI001E41F381|nr:restriction endonuclease subunit S [Enterococcus faecalis]MCD5032268.1 restriction endonuclease subunit S [Enterococcus faecalis]
MSNNTQPEIRFPGFTDDWEERKLKELFQPSKNKNNNGLYNQKDILAASLGTELIPKRTFFGLKSTRESVKNYRIVKTGDLIYTKSPIKGFPNGIIRSNKGNVGIVPPLYCVYTLQKDINSSIIQLYFEDKNRLNFYLFPLVNVGARNNVNITDLEFLEGKVTIPKSYEEQSKIVQFMEQLNTTIALHQRKLDLLKETKKGFLQKMFPKNGAKVPEVRFPGFTGDWEDRKLGEVVVFLNGRAFKQQELLDSGKYRVLRVGNFNTNDRWYYSNLELEEDKYANKGDLLYLWATSFGPEMWNEERVIYHYHIWKLKFLSKELDKQYLYTWLLTDKEKIKESTNGTTMVHVTKGGIEQRTFQFPPDINEQQKIGNFFKQLDDTIALHQRKLDLLKETKKGFLQKMFV